MSDRPQQKNLLILRRMSERKLILNSFEQRGSGKEEAIAREEEATEQAGNYEAILVKQQESVFAALDLGADIKGAIERAEFELKEVVASHYLNTGLLWAEEIILTIRGFEDDVADGIGGFLEAESIILTELSHIQAGTVRMILDQVADGLLVGASIAEIKQFIQDVGAFGPERALRISRTVTGAAASIGQLISGQLSGATMKTWQDSTFDVRKVHAIRDGETVPIDGRFSVQLKSIIGPRFPGDPEISAGDRINCRCSLTFT